jgi:hypothetical protein
MYIGIGTGAVPTMNLIAQKEAMVMVAGGEDTGELQQ